MSTKATEAKTKEIWDDTVHEADVVIKFKVSKETLRRYRRNGRIKNFRYISPGTTGNPLRPGKKPVYSMKELNEIFSATA